MRQLPWTLALVCLLSTAPACQRRPVGPSDGPAAQAAGPIRGTISAAAALKVEPGNVLYVIARAGNGPPAGVKRIENPVFPLPFALGPEDSIVPGVPFTGPFTIKARLSRTGEAMPQPGDVEGAFPDPVQPGQNDVNIVLGQVH